MEVKVINKSQYPLPQYSSVGSAGVDLRADIREPIVIEHEKRVLIPTGLYVELPEDYELQIRPRSGLALKNGITVLNTPGTVDSDYRGEIGVILYNTGSDFTINPGDKIAQTVLSKYTKIEWEECDTLSNTDRSSGGFGHSGV